MEGFTIIEAPDYIFRAVALETTDHLNIENGIGQPFEIRDDIASVATYQK